MGLSFEVEITFIYYFMATLIPYLLTSKSGTVLFTPITSIAKISRILTTPSALVCVEVLDQSTPDYQSATLSVYLL